MKSVLTLMFFILFFLNCHSIEIQLESTMNTSQIVHEKKKAFTVALGIFPITKPLEPNCVKKSDRILIKRDYIDIGIHLLINPFLSSKTIYVYCQ